MIELDEFISHFILRRDCEFTYKSLACLKAYIELFSKQI